MKRLIVRVRNLNKYPSNKKTSEKFLNDVDSMKNLFDAPASAFLKDLKKVAFVVKIKKCQKRSGLFGLTKSVKE